MSTSGTTTRSTIGRLDVVTASKTIIRDVGALQVLIGGLLLVPLLVSVLYREWFSALAFLSSTGITVLCGVSHTNCVKMHPNRSTITR